MQRLYTPPPLLPAVITSADTINISAGAQIDYTIEADNGSYYEWDDFSEFIEGTTNTLAVQDNNIRQIKGTFFQPGVRVLTFRVWNASGFPIAIGTLTITVGPPFSSFAVAFENFDFTTATADTSNPLYRLDNASGTPWTFSNWMQPQVNNNVEQTIMSFGGDNQATEGRVQLWHNGTLDRITLRYGTNADFIQMETPVLSVLDEGRYNFVVTYDGGTTGGDVLDANDYYSRFNIYINGVLQSTTNSIGNDGFIGEIVPDAFKFGENINAGSHLRDFTLLDDIALWDLDATGVSGMIDEIYNEGVQGDLTLISNPPEHYWLMGDGDTFPTLQDTGSVATYDMTMTNMTAGNIVTFPPGPTGRSADDVFDIFDLISFYNEANQIATLPSAVSANSATIAAFDFFDYTLDVANTAEITWVNLPLSVNVDEYDRRRIFGVFEVEEVRVITARIESVFGTNVDFDITVTVTPKFDQFSTQFNNSEYTDATADTSNPLYAVGPSGNPWSMACWFRGGTSNNGEQTLLSFGGSAQAGEGRVQLWMDGGNDLITFRYGTNGRYVEKSSAAGTILDDEWNHIIVTYDGGITGGNIGDNPDSVYLGAFKIYINDVLVTTTDVVGSGGGLEGWPSGIVDDFFRFGMNCSAGNHLRNDSLLNEIAIWDEDVSATAGLTTEIYGIGVGHDLSTITSPPEHWWRMGDSDTFPTLQDTGSVGTYDMTMTNMVAGDIVQEAP